jgi:branched-chain amino acid transport system ATP-binding protein
MPRRASVKRHHRVGAEGISILLMEQNARMSLEIADHAYVLDDAKVVYAGADDDLRRDQDLVDRLAGVRAE